MSLSQWICVAAVTAGYFAIGYNILRWERARRN